MHLLIVRLMPIVRSSRDEVLYKLHMLLTGLRA